MKIRKILTSLIIVLLLVLSGCKKKQQQAVNPPVVEYYLTLDYQSDMDKKVIKTTGAITLETPTYEGYKFLGWYLDDELFTATSISKDTTLVAKWLELEVEYHISYFPQSGEMPYHTTSYFSGREKILPIPTLKNHKFMGWYKDKDYVDGPYEILNDITSGDLTLFAKWEETATFEKISYELNGGELPENAVMKYVVGEEYVLEPATKKDCFFRGFYDNPDFNGSPIRSVGLKETGPITLYAKWEDLYLSSANISIYGDSVSTFNGYHPEGYAPYYGVDATKSLDVKNVEDTWWYQTITRLNAKLCVNSSYSGTGVAHGGIFATDKDRIKTMRNNDLDPDVILIFMGINDCKVGYDLNMFLRKYEEMINSIQDEFKSAHIFLFTLHACTFRTSDSSKIESLRLQYNKGIIELAEKYNLPVVDIASELTPDKKVQYMANDLHTNKKGMEAIATMTVKAIREYFIG